MPTRTTWREHSKKTRSKCGDLQYNAKRRFYCSLPDSPAESEYFTTSFGQVFCRGLGEELQPGALFDFLTQ
jgi:hypothetical protein